MSHDSFVHLTDYSPQVEAPSKALQEKREAWSKANLDKPQRDFLLWVQEVANEPQSGLTNRQRREWVRKERLSMIRTFTGEHLITVLSELLKRFPEGS
jgi:hypothetical protein